MKRSEQRILTTHTGSLPRPPALRDLLVCQYRGAAGAEKFAEAFMTAASPGVIATIMLDAYYGSHERYVKALAREMRKEYALIVGRGFVLQLDCPDLAMERARFFQDEPLDGFLRGVALHIDAINEAIAGLPADRIRLHLCWGNYDGPHTHDVSLEPLLPIVYRAQVGALSLPLASPRHQPELRAFRRHPLPDGMLFVPGVIDSTTNVVEHPEVVADRIVAAAEAIGDRTRVLAGVDCGFGTFAGSQLVEESVVWTKLRALREGADLATRRLWKRGGRARIHHRARDVSGAEEVVFDGNRREGDGRERRLRGHPRGRGD